jgi:hypothetical protein
MKREIIFTLTILLILSGIVLIEARITPEIKECRNDCINENKLSKAVCIEEFNECRLNCEDGRCKRNCSLERSRCLRILSMEYKTCQKECIAPIDSDINEKTCLENGGIYQQLCTGPYFSVVCSQDKYCLCSGINDYSCPSDMICKTNFVSPIKRLGSIQGWRTLHGEDLGEIGMCVR